jgi:formylglycine-generating enzyme required for sulfatase activity
MAGNVWEWCASWYDEEKTSRVVRGGSWSGIPVSLRLYYRHWHLADARFNVIGFRLAGDIDK